MSNKSNSIFIDDRHSTEDTKLKINKEKHLDDI